jgi:hypothetical protein
VTHRIVRFLARYARAAAGAAWAFTGGLAQPRHRDLVRRIAIHFGHDDMPPRRLPGVAVAAVTRDDTEVVLPEPMAADGNVSLLELLVLARLVRERRPASLLEIGTFDGRTTLALASNAPADARVWTLDLPPTQASQHALAPGERQYVDKPRSGARLAGREAARKVEQLFGDSATFDFAPYRAQFVFVDGSHAYEYVLNDSERAMQVTAGAPATIVWHDYGAWEGVTRALNELRERDPRFGGLQWVEGTTLAVLSSPA